MSDRAVYDGIHAASISKIERNDLCLDTMLLPGSDDTRIGISLIIPVIGLDEYYRELVAELQLIEPSLYLYPVSDLHITIFDFQKCSVAYRPDPDLEGRFAAICSKLRGSPGIVIRFNGIVFSPEAGLIQGFDGDRLVELRRRLRGALEDAGLRNDERYQSRSAHITFARFRDGLRDPRALRDFVEANRERELSSLDLSRIELVEHDWYNTARRKRLISTILLE